MEQDEQEPQKTLGTGFLSVVRSVFAAIFGIQSSKNREKDFQQGEPTDFIVVGIIAVFLLVVGMIVFVKSVIPD